MTRGWGDHCCSVSLDGQRRKSDSSYCRGRGTAQTEGEVGWGGRTAVAAGAAGRRSGGPRCRRCCGDTAVDAVIGCGEIGRKHRETGSSARETGGDEGGAEGAVGSWP